MKKPEFRTRRLLLRQPVARDAAQIAELADNINLARNLGTMPHPYKLGDAEEWIERTRDSAGINQFNFAILQDKENYLMGVVSVFNLTISKPELGFWLGEPYWGQGFMREAVSQMCEFAFTQLAAPFLISRHMLDNPASGRVVEKLGFVEFERAALWSRARQKFSPGRALRLQRMDWQGTGRYV